jgi:antitoxin CptB
MIDAKMHEEQARLRWQCRRGMLELDVLLSNFFETQYAQLPIEKREIFKKLLYYPDQELYHWFLNHKTPQDLEMAEMVQLIIGN